MDNDTYNTLHSFNNNSNESQLNMKRHSPQGNYNINTLDSTQDKTYCLNNNVFSNTIGHNEIVQNINENQTELKNHNNFEKSSEFCRNKKYFIRLIYNTEGNNSNVYRRCFCCI